MDQSEEAPDNSATINAIGMENLTGFLAAFGVPTFLAVKMSASEQIVVTTFVVGIAAALINMQICRLRIALLSKKP